VKDDLQAKVINFVTTALSQAIGSMTGGEFAVAFEENVATPPSLENAITWQQSFSIVDTPCFWICAGKDLWESMGRVTLEAAGIDEVTDEDSRSTWQEILNQTVAGVASGMTADQGTEVTASKGGEIQNEPANVTWLTFSVTDSAGKKWSFKAGWTSELASFGESRQEETESPTARDSSVSKTFDLLLEVALPVAVSFGRTSLQIREVLKLNTGSIVELDRFVSDPVEVIVNDCVIARGEVVVVDGNYGVRISQLASREDRLRSGMVESHHKGGRV
jgi:flagellar motor switch protein FliN/FliY